MNIFLKYKNYKQHFYKKKTKTNKQQQQQKNNTDHAKYTWAKYPLRLVVTFLL